MNVKVIAIVVGVVVVGLLAMPLVLGAATGNLKPAGPTEDPNAEWTTAKLTGTKWGIVQTVPVPEIVGQGTITADVVVTFSNGGVLIVTPNMSFSPEVPAGLQNMAKSMIAQIPQGTWSIKYPNVTVSMPDAKTGEVQSVTATIQGDTITAAALPGMSMPVAGADVPQSVTLTRRY